MGSIRFHQYTERLYALQVLKQNGQDGTQILDEMNEIWKHLTDAERAEINRRCVKHTKF